MKSILKYAYHKTRQTELLTSTKDVYETLYTSLPVLRSFSSSILTNSAPALTPNSGCTIGLVFVNVFEKYKLCLFLSRGVVLLFCSQVLDSETLFCSARHPITMLPHLVGYLCVHMPVSVYTVQVRLYFVIGPTIDKAKRFNCRPSGPSRTIGHGLLVCRSTYDVTSHMIILIFFFNSNKIPSKHLLG